MMISWALFLVLLPFISATCPPGLAPEREGECRGIYATLNDVPLVDALNITLETCYGIDAHPVIIRNSEHQSYWTGEASFNNEHPIVLALVCNLASRKWEWADGSTVDYRPDFVWENFDDDCQDGMVWVIAAYPLGIWIPSQNGLSDPSKTSNIAVGCYKQLPPLPTPADDQCDNGFDLDSGDRVCYQVETGTVNFEDAKAACNYFGGELASIHNSQENAFIRRLSVPVEAVNGLYLGVGLTGKSDFDYEWLDGSPFDYSNFKDGYPTDASNECVIMDTSNTAGQWKNVDCSHRFSVACMRHVGIAPTCPQGPWKGAGEFTSPGYPYSSNTPCDYILTAEEGKRVEITVDLEANECCDHLILYDIAAHGHQTELVMLSGALYNSTYTSLSNSMRVSWQPNGGVNVQGMTVSFRSI